MLFQQDRRGRERDPLEGELGCDCPVLPSCGQPELLDLYTVNLHRIEKDVQRCDRNYWYFTPANLEKLRNIMCRWLERGQGRACRGSDAVVMIIEDTY